MEYTDEILSTRSTLPKPTLNKGSEVHQACRPDTNISEATLLKSSPATRENQDEITGTKNDTKKGQKELPPSIIIHKSVGSNKEVLDKLMEVIPDNELLAYLKLNIRRLPEQVVGTVLDLFQKKNDKRKR